MNEDTTPQEDAIEGPAQDPSENTQDPAGSEAPEAPREEITLGQARAWAEYNKIRTDTELTRLSCERATLENERARLEISGLKRREDEAAAAHAELRYTFYDAVTGESVRRALAELAVWARRDPAAGITIVFNSPGGSVLDGLALYDYLRYLSSEGHHVTTMALGRAASMGAVLLQAGDTRVIGRNAFLMIHEVASGSVGKLWEMEESLEFFKRLEGRLLDLLTERSNLTRAQVKRKWTKTDWWLDAEEAVAAGFADEIR